MPQPAPPPRVVLLAGGLGTRLAEETSLRPKPMVLIGDRPILWHIMKRYASYGCVDFVICLGYMGYFIKEYFANYLLHNADVTIDLASGERRYHGAHGDGWRVTMIDTGALTPTGGRIRRIRPYLDAGTPFCLTYGDGLADIDFAAQWRFHADAGRLVTMTTVHPPARFGAARVSDGEVTDFAEKAVLRDGVVNGGFFVVQPEALDYIEDDDEAWEGAPLHRLVEARQVSAWEHQGFWQPMDTVRERDVLNGLWRSGEAPWCNWTPA